MFKRVAVILMVFLPVVVFTGCAILESAESPGIQGEWISSDGNEIFVEQNGTTFIASHKSEGYQDSGNIGLFGVISLKMGNPARVSDTTVSGVVTPDGLRINWDGGEFWARRTVSVDPVKGDRPGFMLAGEESAPSHSAVPSDSNCPAGYSTWITDNIDILGNKKLTEISIPGSHDAGMYEANKCSFAGVGGPTACNTKTQEITVGQQLYCGVRYFDLRPVYTKDKEFYTGHFTDKLGNLGCLGGSLDEILDEVEGFSSKNPRELVILKFSHYYDRMNDKFGFSEPVLTELTELVQLKLSRLVKHNSSLNLMAMSYDDILAYGRIIAVFDELQTDDWGTGIIRLDRLPVYDEYSETNDFEKMKNNQFDKLKDHGGSANELFLLSWTLTQNKKQAATCNLDPTGETSSIRDLAIVANKNFNSILDEQNTINKKANIIYTDFVDGSSTWVAMQTNGITNNPGSISCEEDDDCANDTCARKEAGGDNMICCPSNKSGIYAGYSYCYGMLDGNRCWSDAMCANGYCKGNSGGLQKGICTSKLGPGQTCDVDSDCVNDACARKEAGGDNMICCPSNKSGIYAGYSYCYGMQNGNKCWSDAMCASGRCKGNWSGIKKGTCAN
ncbi:MAG: hypothetical protein HKP41_10585 [Desulfobacterales bacterium]|nr:hypothetical protein [Desulfobacterales bacterium]